MIRVLLLGGTTEASLMAQALAQAGIAAVFSYAGRTETPLVQPLPTRIGGFGGVDGLRRYVAEAGITHIIDATHPFAAQISRNAVAAGVPLIGLERPPWVAGPGDVWHHVPDNEAAAAALPDSPARVFLAIGKQHLGDFATKPRHHYLLRLVDQPTVPLPLPDITVILARGPFSDADDTDLLRHHRISHIVAKNAGGAGAQAKLVAARHLGLPVILVGRPALPPRPVAGSVAEVMAWLGHSTPLGV